MKESTSRIKVRRQKAARVDRSPGELSELRATRARFQREKPTLEEVLAANGEREATTLGEYLQTRELLQALQRERQRQNVTLAQLADRTGYDVASLSRLFTGKQANTTLATVGRIANALGKTLVHSLADAAATSVAEGRRRKAEIRRRKAEGGRRKAGVREA